MVLAPFRNDIYRCRMLLLWRHRERNSAVHAPSCVSLHFCLVDSNDMFKYKTFDFGDVMVRSLMMSVKLVIF